jgi:threonylcarbamoyladenosine tRNA methylthiotransferase MtaB
MRVVTVETVTLGCRLNFAESETIARTAPKGEQWVVVNSCSVTNEAVRQTRQAIRKAHRRRPDARILVTGCAAELDRRSFELMPEVSRVVGNAGKLRPSTP